MLDRIPIGALIYRNDSLLYANRHFLELTGYQSLETLTAAGWLNGLVAETDAGTLKVGGSPSTLSLTTSNGTPCQIEARACLPFPGRIATALRAHSNQRQNRGGAGGHIAFAERR